MPRILDVVFWAIMLAIVFVLVRPGSKAGTAVASISTALIGIVGDVTGWSGNAASGNG